MKLKLKDQSSREKQQSTIKKTSALSVRTRRKPLFILPLLPAIFKENISVFNFLLLGTVKLVISKFKFAEYIRKTSSGR